MSNETKWTKGPWVSHEHGVGELIVYDALDQTCICSLIDCDESLAWKHDYSVSEEGRANAQLISAAPELYEALQTCLDCLGDEFALPGDIIDDAEAALAKARGEL